MIKEIVTDLIFLSRKSEPASKEDVQTSLSIAFSVRFKYLLWSGEIV